MTKSNKSFFERLFSFLQRSSAQYDSKDELVSFPEDFEQTFQETFPTITNYSKGRGKIKFEKSVLPFPVFWTDDSFLQRVTPADLLQDIGIFNLAGDQPRFFDQKNQVAYFRGDRSNTHFFSNTKAYFDLLAFLEQKNHHEKGDYEFVDFFNRGLQQVVFSSSEGQGRVILQFPQGVLHFDEQKDLHSAVEELKEGFIEQNKNLPVFFKNEIINHLKRVPEERKALNFFSELKTILDNARVNFNVYLHGLSIDKIKRDYKKYKDKYFEQINNILSKLTSQVIALPVTLIGAAYAIEKANVTVEVQVIILIAIVLTTVLLIYFLRLHKTDLVFIEETFTSEYKALRESDFFLEHEEELEDFDTMENHIRQRIKFVRSFLYVYFWIMCVFNLVLVGFILMNLKVSLLLVFIALLISLILLALAFWFFLKP